jgi:hypothetical protein
MRRNSDTHDAWIAAIVNFISRLQPRRSAALYRGAAFAAAVGRRRLLCAPPVRLLLVSPVLPLLLSASTRGGHRSRERFPSGFDPETGESAQLSSRECFPSAMACCGPRRKLRRGDAGSVDVATGRRGLRSSDRALRPRPSSKNPGGRPGYRGMGENRTPVCRHEPQGRDGGAHCSPRLRAGDFQGSDSRAPGLRSWAGRYSPARSPHWRV